MIYSKKAIRYLLRVACIALMAASIHAQDTTEITKIEFGMSQNGPVLGHIGINHYESPYLSDTSVVLFADCNHALRIYGGKMDLFTDWGDINLAPRGENKSVVIKGSDNVNNHILEVHGSIGARELVITDAAWADYVFSDSYELRPLSAVADSIEQNKRLPQMPSEQQVKEEGLSVGEMQAKMMQKIEELTLYMIEMNQENAKLKGEIAKLHKRIESYRSATQ